MIILAEAWGIVVLAAFAIFAYILKDTFTVPTRAEKAKRDSELEAAAKHWEEENRKQREYEAWKASRYPNSVNNNNSYTSKSSSSADSYSSSDRKGFFSALGEVMDEHYTTKGDVTDSKYGKSCSNCSHYDGYQCTCDYSSHSGRSISSPSSMSCGYHNY